jgi:tetratricopeptide (TPR) repeat protein
MTSSTQSFFILGLPRSGTTALAYLLDSSPVISCLSYEGNILYRLWRILSRHNVFSEPEEDLLVDFEVTAKLNLSEESRYNIDPGSQRFSLAQIDELVKTFKDELRLGLSQTAIFSRVAQNFFSLMTAFNNKKVVGDKVPDYIHIPHILTNALPDSKFIYIKRDSMATVHSTLAFFENTLHLFVAPDAFAIAVSCLLKQDGIGKFIKQSPLERVCVVDQEEVCNFPEHVLERVCQFLGLSGDLKFGLPAKKITGIKNWKKEMAFEDICKAESVYHAAKKNSCGGHFLSSDNNKWLSLAMSVVYLLNCEANERTTIFSKVITSFEEKRELKTLGYTFELIGNYYHMTGETQLAEQFFNNAVSLAPLTPAIWFKFGELCFDVKKLDKAEVYYEKVLELAPETDYYALLRAKSIYQLGRIHRLNNFDSKAENFFKKAVEVFPGFQLAKAMLAIL